MYPPEGANLHQWLTKKDMGIYSPLVDLMGNYQLGQNAELYMLDALICAPFETVYYDGNGKPIVNLGVHEHWNNSAQKQYSGNLGGEEGIELPYLSVFE